MDGGADARRMSLLSQVALDVLPLEEALALLESRAGRKDAAGAKTLADALGRLPLALDHAAAYCKRTHMQFGDYAKKASTLIDVAPRGAAYPRSIAATFDLAITEVVAQCPAAETLMAYLAGCAPWPIIPMTLVEDGLENEAERLQALTALTEVSLLKHDTLEDGTPAVTLHHLVQEVALARAIKTDAVETDAVKKAHERLIASWLAAICPEAGLRFTPAWSNQRWADHMCEAPMRLARAAALRGAFLDAMNLQYIAKLFEVQGDLVGARLLLERAVSIYPESSLAEHALNALGRFNAIGAIGPQFRSIFKCGIMRTLGLVATMHKSLIVILLPLLGIVCGAQTPPTATEAFNLRIRCKQMADQKAGELAAGNAALRWEVFQSSGSSRYDATNNRCYIRIYHHIRKPGFERVVSQLYDAQVDDLLASANIDNGKKNGVIFDESYKGNRWAESGDAGWDVAIKYMDELMADPRKP